PSRISASLCAVGRLRTGPGGFETAMFACWGTERGLRRQGASEARRPGGQRGIIKSLEVAVALPKPIGGGLIAGGIDRIDEGFEREVPEREARPTVFVNRQK